MILWRYNPIIGLWRMERACTAETCNEWLRIFRRDEPTAIFRLAKNKPSKPPASLDGNYRERIRGGKASGRRPSDFNPTQLRRGIAVELEHTRSRDIAREIAMDHLTEDPAYYRKLAKIHLDGIDVTKNFVRERQFPPGRCAKGSFRTITRGSIKLVVCCPKGKWRHGRCRVGTRAQSILRPR